MQSWNSILWNYICWTLPVEFSYYVIEATHFPGPVVSIDKWREQINVKRHVNHHSLPLQLHPGAVGHQSCLLCFFPLLQQLASLQEQLDSLVEKWSAGGSLTSSPGGGNLYQLGCCVIPFSLSFPYITSTAYWFLYWKSVCFYKVEEMCCLPLND